TTLARRITMCYGSSIWIPRVMTEDGQLIKLFDAACHEPISDGSSGLLKSAEQDRRWVKIRRPTVVVGGELTLDALEIRHDPASNIIEASLQLKSNCGCPLIDDFGRQRISPTDLLNRWIIPLENRHDFLTLATGKKIQVPFEQLIIFSTNLEPKDLVDEAFLRRIPYKIEIGDPDEQEFHELFELYARAFECEYRPEVVDHVLKHHYRAGRQRRASARARASAGTHHAVHHRAAAGDEPDVVVHERLQPACRAGLRRRVALGARPQKHERHLCQRQSHPVGHGGQGGGLPPI